MAEPGITAIFKTLATPNLRKSQEAGRPIFDDMEVVEIRFAGNRDNAPVFPAHDVSQQQGQSDGTSIALTYAERFPKEYEAFKAGQTQVADGTPLSELPFLTESKRAELRKQNIHTAETLSLLDGYPLKQLGMDGRQIVEQTKAYLQRAAGTASDVRLAAENDALRAQIAAMMAERDAPVIGATAKQSDQGLRQSNQTANPFEGMSDEQLREYIKSKTGSAPRGQPSRETLERMARDADSV